MAFDNLQSTGLVASSCFMCGATMRVTDALQTIINVSIFQYYYHWAK